MDDNLQSDQPDPRGTGPGTDTSQSAAPDPPPDDGGMGEVLEYLERLKASLLPVWENFLGLAKAEWRYLRTMTVEGSRYIFLRAALTVTMLVLLILAWVFLIVTIWTVIETYCPVPWAAPFAIMILHLLPAWGIKIHLERTRL
ncbi:hypothetical protein KQI84_00685 [bacterium]|nr:hypothetical protein [bacterium]